MKHGQNIPRLIARSQAPNKRKRMDVVPVHRFNGPDIAQIQVVSLNGFSTVLVNGLGCE